VAEKKGLTVLVHAMKDVVDAHPNAELWLVGPDADIFAPYKARLKNLVSALGLEKNVKFVGVVKFVEPYYEACDFLVLPSLHSEGFGLPIVEAARFGKPAVATEIFRETGVVTKRTGLIVPSNDVRRLSSAMLSLLKNRGLRKKLGDRAKRFSKKFDWDVAALEFERVLKNLSA
jgi:glycosyltransferase involved in cell wall biosynthesis